VTWPRALASAVVALALVTGPVVAASAAGSDVSDFSFDSFDAVYTLGLDEAGHATTHVTETLVARFPDYDQNRGIIRAIPLKDGDVPLDVTMLSITDETGAAVPYERNDYDGFAEFALGTDDYVHGPTTYVLEYTMANTIRHYPDDDVDEFYWDINGTGWAQTFDSVSAKVLISAELADSLNGDATCYSGYYGSEDQCDLVLADATVDGEQYTVYSATTGPLYSYSTMTLAIGFDAGAVVQPPLARDSWIVTIAPTALLALAGLVVILSIIVKTAVWRDKRGRGTIVAQYEPPRQEGESLLLDADLIGRPSAGLPAQFVDFAVRGMVKVIDTETSTADAGEHGRFALELITADGANAQETKVLAILFGASLQPGKRVYPGALRADIGASLYGLPSSTAAYALKEGYRFQPDGAAPKILGRIAFFTVLAFLPIWIWAAVNDVLSAGVIWSTIGTVVLALAVPAVLSRPRRLTEKGALAKEYLLGVREYLTIAEEDRMRVLQSPEGAERIDVTDRDAVVKLYERLLPYAVLWGVEDQWAEYLRARYEGATPDWLDGAAFDASVLRSFTVSSTSSVRPIVTSSSGGSSWSSSGGSSFSSGSSGGGFSGGGGGGGGGGGR
jgi:uncharacterized membrane protein YgcG